MKKWLKYGSFGAAVALAGLASAQTPGMMDHGHEEERMETGSLQGTTGIELAGVVTEVSGDTLTVITPLESEAQSTRIGSAYIIDRESRLVAFSGQIAEDTPVMRDGKTAKISDIKEGDVIRTSFDPQKETFGSADVISRNKIGKELKKELKTLKKERE